MGARSRASRWRGSYRCRHRSLVDEGLGAISTEFVRTRHNAAQPGEPPHRGGQRPRPVADRLGGLDGHRAALGVVDQSDRPSFGCGGCSGNHIIAPLVQARMRADPA